MESHFEQFSVTMRVLQYLSVYPCPSVQSVVLSDTLAYVNLKVLYTLEQNSMSLFSWSGLIYMSTCLVLPNSWAKE